MRVTTEVDRIVPSKENLGKTLRSLQSSLDFLTEQITEIDSFRDEKENIMTQYAFIQKLYDDRSLIEISDVNLICEYLDKMVDKLSTFDNEAAFKITDERLSWDDSDLDSWYQKGKIVFELFVEKKIEDFQSTVNIFNHIIKLTENSEKHKELAFWSYCFIGNLYLYQILTGEEALEKAMKHYNQAYRFAKKNDVKVDDEFIFENVEILQQILMNQYPLLIVVYNSAGIRMYEYLFQFIEVMTEDKRFIPNLTALLSAVDSGIDELFRAPISSSYMIIKNRLMVLSTLHSGEDGEWVKMAMVFSYLHQSAYEVDFDQVLLEKVKRFNEKMMENDIISTYLINFRGLQDDNAYSTINDLIASAFSMKEME